MAWRYREARERAEFTRATGSYSPVLCAEDRFRLIELGERLRYFVDHKWECAVARQLRAGAVVQATCDCGLVALLRELGD